MRYSLPLLLRQANIAPSEEAILPQNGSGRIPGVLLLAGSELGAGEQAAQAGQEQLRSAAADVPEHPGSFITRYPAERLQYRSADGIDQAAVIVLAEAVQRAANEQMDVEFAAQRAKLGAGAILQDGLTDAESAAEPGHDAADGGDFHLAGGVANQKDAAAAYLRSTGVQRV